MFNFFIKISTSIYQKIIVQNLYKLGLINDSITQETKCLKISQFYTSDANVYSSSVKIGSISFFSSSNMHQSHNLFGCHAAGMNSSFNSSLSALPFSNLVCQAKSLTWIIVSGSS